MNPNEVQNERQRNTGSNDSQYRAVGTVGLRLMIDVVCTSMVTCIHVILRALRGPTVINPACSGIGEHQMLVSPGYVRMNPTQSW